MRIGIIESMQIGAHVALAGSPVDAYQLMAAVADIIQLGNCPGKSKRVRNGERITIVHLNVPNSIRLAAARIKEVGPDVRLALVE